MSLHSAEIPDQFTEIGFEGFRHDDEITPEERCSQALSKLFNNQTPQENLKELSKEGLNEQQFLDVLMQLTNHQHQPQDLIDNLIDITDVLSPSLEPENSREPLSLQQKLITIYSEIVEL
jgi:hypothetical protein